MRPFRSKTPRLALGTEDQSAAWDSIAGAGAFSVPSVFESAPVAVGSCVQKPPWECSGVNQEGGGRGGDGPEQAGSHPSKEGLTPVPARVFSLEGHWIFQKAEGLTCRVSSRVARVSLRLWTETRHRVHRSLRLS